MKRHILAIICALAAVVCLSGCDSFKQIRVTSFEIVSISPRGMDEIDALVKVGIHNPGVAFEVTDVRGTANLKDMECLTLTSDQLIVFAKCDKVYSVPVHGSLADGFNPFQLLQFLNNQMNPNDVTLDLRARVALRGGPGKVIDLKGIPLDKLIHANENAL